MEDWTYVVLLVELCHMQSCFWFGASQSTAMDMSGRSVHLKREENGG